MNRVLVGAGVVAALAAVVFLVVGTSHGSKKFRIKGLKHEASRKGTLQLERTSKDAVFMVLPYQEKTGDQAIKPVLVNGKTGSVRMNSKGRWLVLEVKPVAVLDGGNLMPCRPVGRDCPMPFPDPPLPDPPKGEPPGWLMFDPSMAMPN